MDIVKRLREGRNNGTDLRWIVTEVHLEAAAEIERLRAELAERDALLATAREALAEYACHGGYNAPCIRTKFQCRADCGRKAGDALLLIETSPAIASGEYRKGEG